MSAITLKKDPDIDEDGVNYPSRDGKPMAETSTHVVLMAALISMLQQYYRNRLDVYAIGNILLYYEKGNPAARRSPDVMVIKGVKPGPRRSFKIWEEKAVSCVVIELTSKKTAAEDLGPKKNLYEMLGVREYYLFDPLGEYLPKPLLGYQLRAGKYRPMKSDKKGGFLSRELGLRLVPESVHLAMIDSATGERLLTLEEAESELEELRKRYTDIAAELNQLKKTTKPIDPR